MAGGKETPRQKMIGMMYLVLLALLALQMGQSILTKFRQLDESLTIAVNDATGKNVSINQNIAASVKEGGGKQQNVLDLSADLRKKSGDMISYIDQLKKDLIEATGGVNEEGVYEGMKDTDKSGTFMVGPGDKKIGKGYELKEKYLECRSSARAL